MACTHKSRLVTAKCQRPLWSTLWTQVGYIPRSEKCQNRTRAPQLSITLSGWASSLSGISLRIRSAQSTSGRVCQAFGIVGEEPAPVSYSTISVGEIRFQI
jgi:hypothetical protein